MVTDYVKHTGRFSIGNLVSPGLLITVDSCLKEIILFGSILLISKQNYLVKPDVGRWFSNSKILFAEIILLTKTFSQSSQKIDYIYSVFFVYMYKCNS